MNVSTDNGQEHDRYGIEKMCASKHRYATKKIAMKCVIVRNRERKKIGKSPLRPYKCPYCGQYHLTSNERDSDA